MSSKRARLPGDVVWLRFGQEEACLLKAGVHQSYRLCSAPVMISSVCTGLSTFWGRHVLIHFILSVELMSRFAVSLIG